MHCVRSQQMVNKPVIERQQQNTLCDNIYVYCFIHIHCERIQAVQFRAQTCFRTLENDKLFSYRTMFLCKTLSQKIPPIILLASCDCYRSVHRFPHEQPYSDKNYRIYVQGWPWCSLFCALENFKATQYTINTNIISNYTVKHCAM